MKRRLKGLALQEIVSSENPTILFHCASAGEYEQVSPIINAFKTQYPSWRVVLSFFSPSGIEWIKKKDIKIEHLYLPFDTKHNMEQFVKDLNPSAVVIAKNELWFNLLIELQERKIPHYIVAASFKKNHFIFRYKSFQNILSKVTSIFTIDQISQSRISEKMSNAQLFGDPRIDRIIEKSKNPNSLSFFNRKDKPIIIYASLHREDIFLLNGIREDQDYLHIIVPHDIHESEIDFFKSHLGAKINLSSVQKTWDKSILLVDEIGILADLYKYSSHAYIGGGFGKGIHNILEAAIHKNNIFVGPNNNGFQEARILLNDKAIYQVSKKDTILKCVKSLNTDQQKDAQLKIHQFFVNNNGASHKITNAITKDLHDIR